jgi:hypothetical protein
MFGEHAHFVDAIAYWLWQFAPSLSTLICLPALLTDQLVVHVELVEHESWEQNNVPFPHPSSASVEVETEPGEGSV